MISPFTTTELVPWPRWSLAFAGLPQTGSRAGSAQSFCELTVESLDSHIRDTMRVEPAPYRAFIGASPESN